MIPHESTPKFSPPPWHRDQWGHIIDSAGEPVQFKGVSIAMGKDATAEANTDLATAAPKLYGVVHGLIAALDSYELDDIAITEPVRIGRLVLAEIEEGGGS